MKNNIFTKKMMKSRDNIEVLKIIVSAWYLHMSHICMVCAKQDNKYDDRIMTLINFITNREANPSDVFLSTDEYVNDSIDYYNKFKVLSKGIKYSRWKSLSKNSLIGIYGQHFEVYLTNEFDINFLKYLPFLKLSKRQLARIFIKIREKV